MLKTRNTRKAFKTVATFGSAFASFHCATHLQAAIVPVSFNPDSVSLGGSATLQLFAPDLLGNIYVSNNSAFGKSFATGFGVQNLSPVSLSQLISFGEITNSYVYFTYNATGTRYIGFTSGANVGWFSVNLGGNTSPMVFLAGEFGNSGESLHVGGTAIPEPASATGLALLALGAAGLRRRRTSE